MKSVLISGASFAGLSTAYWMNKLGYKVVVVEIAKGLKKGGTPVNIQENTVDVVRRMGLMEQIESNNIHMELMEFKNADDVTEKAMPMRGAGRAAGDGPADDRPADDRAADDRAATEEYEIERDTLLNIMYEAVKDDVEFIFSESVMALDEDNDGIDVTFKGGQKRLFDLVFGCDGVHSAVRKNCFGEEAAYSHFLQAYFSITIVDKLLIPENVLQLYNEPGKSVMLNAYNHKTDIVLCFYSAAEIAYDYRDEEQQRKMIEEQFSSVGWRTPELLAEVKMSTTFYFDKLCQIKMPSWTKGRVALVGDAGYCASPAAGKGGSLAIDGAAALADAFEKCNGDFELAFAEYNRSFRPYIEQVQADAARFGVEMFVPRTEEAIRARNSAE